MGNCAADFLAIVSHYPKLDERIRISQLQRQGGGEVATALAALSRLGISTSFIGKIGDDDLGVFIRNEFSEEGVDISHLIIEKNKNSLFAFCVVDKKSAKRTIFWDKGCLCKSKNKCFVHSPFKVKVVDTTGAGDAFHGAFIYGMLKKWNLEKIAEFSNAVAAINCTKLGGRSGLPNLKEVNKFLDEKRGKLK